MAGEVKQNPYSVGYVELIYALQNNLGYGQVLNAAGTYINPSLEGVTAAAASASNNLPADLRFSIVNAPGATSYPISSSTWLLAYQNMNDPAKAIAVTRMLWWAAHEAQQYNAALKYATMPADITARSEQMVRQIMVDGVSIFPGM